MQWVKILHLLAIISWMAGLLYLPRLFVYHADSAVGSEVSDTFIIMERRLLKAIMTPAMIVTLITGFTMAVQLHLFSQGWFHVKLLAVVGLMASHLFFVRCQRQFAAGLRVYSSRAFRMMNEIPTLLMVVVVIFVVLRPF